MMSVISILMSLGMGLVPMDLVIEIRHAILIDYFDDEELIAEQSRRYADRSIIASTSCSGVIVVFL